MIEILTSGVALGVHVPGLLLADRLREQGAEAEVRVLERLLPERVRATTSAMKWAFHRDFRLASAGRRLLTDPSSAVTGRAVDALTDVWRARGVTRFVVLSGFWLPILEKYLAGCEDPPPVDLCHVDSVFSPSFRGLGRSALNPRHIRLADHAGGRVPYSIPVTREPAVPWADRDRRLLVHGGGWGMGTYRGHVPEFRDRGWELDVLAYEQADVTADEGIRYFMLDPAWHPWQDNGYPPFGRALPGEPVRYTRGTGHHGSFDLARTATAMVSKPGGGTLLDSLWSATPLVLLDPFGEHEEHNARLWTRLGFAIGLQDWRATGCDPDVLAELHRALLQASARPRDYSRLLAEPDPGERRADAGTRPETKTGPGPDREREPGRNTAPDRNTEPDRETAPDRETEPDRKSAPGRTKEPEVEAS
ncbi:hypothetical protein [Streptomyces sp. NPDC048845]|uniref:hypothetical protein n=1 Tax=Streptomyces sp. NPDC048845 TaxID=3155390 RepID=UPI00341C8DEB